MNARGRHTLLPRAALGLLAVLSLARCDCGAVVGEFDGGFAFADGGRADAGAADASVQDAGGFDAGAKDAGAADAGEADAGLTDAGVADAGEPDSGTLDAGFADAGAADAGAKDAGQVATGPGDGGVEDCDGVDNNGDGLIDIENDGGDLARVCPLTLGVCATARSRCELGAWQPCDYGPNYQLTERRCDGLDNDCDGRVDVSWQRNLLDVDSGFSLPPYAPLFGGHLRAPHVNRRANDLLVTLPYAVLSVSDDLAVTGTLRFATGLNGHAYLFPTGSDWLRIASDFNPVGYGCVFANIVRNDGGFARSSDGGEALLWSDCHSSIGATYAAIVTSDGWVTLAAPTSTGGDIGLLGWTWFGKDGGFLAGTVDAGAFTFSSSILPVLPGNESFLLSSSQLVSTAPFKTKVSRFSLASMSLELLVDVGAPFCDAVSDAPFSWVCSNPFPPYERSWFGSDAGLLTQPFLGLPIVSNASTVGQFAVTSVFDGGTLVPGVVALSSLVGASLQPVATIATLKYAIDIHTHELGGRLVLVTGFDNLGAGICPNCVAEDFFAMYVCAP